MRSTRKSKEKPARDPLLDRLNLIEILAKEVLVRLHERVKEPASLKLLDGMIATISQAGPPTETKEGSLESRIGVALGDIGDLEFTLRLTASGAVLADSTSDV